MSKIHKKIINVTTISFILLLLLAISASANAFRAQSLGGATGLISTPTARIAWDQDTFFLDFGYHVVNDDNSDKAQTHIPKITGSVFGKFEFGVAHDFQQNEYHSDWLLNAKIQFYGKGEGSALALGINSQFLKTGLDTDADGDDDDSRDNDAHQLYLALTYPGNILDMKVETTFVIGKTFGNTAVGVRRSNIDVSIGFDLDFLPNVFKNHVHLIADFANYSYSMQPYGSNAYYRGVFNTGLRIAALKPGKYKLHFDALMLDALDSNRSWAFGVNFGMRIF